MFRLFLRETQFFYDLTSSLHFVLLVFRGFRRSVKTNLRKQFIFQGNNLLRMNLNPRERIYQFKDKNYHPLHIANRGHFSLRVMSLLRDNQLEVTR